MWIFVLLVIAVLCISLFDFFVTRTWHEVTYGEGSSQTEKLRLRHKRANSIRKSYNRIMLLLVGGLVIGMGLSLYTKALVGNFYPAARLEKPDYDTTKLSLEAPPLEEIETLPNNYELKGNSSRDAEAMDEQAEAKGAETNKPVQENPQKNNAPSGNTGAPEKPSTSTNPPDKNIKIKNGDIKSEYDKSQQQYNEMMARAEEKRKQREQQKADAERKRLEGKNTNPKNTPPTSKRGEADVDWNHSLRRAHQGNDDFVPTPKYMCDAGGKVVILAKVGSDGYVKSATPQSTGVAGCLIEEAQKYAMKARFETSSNPMQEVKLTYTFYY